MDNYFFTSGSTHWNHTHLPWRSMQSYHTTNTYSYTQIEAIMQHHITAFSPVSKTWITWCQYKHLIEYSPSKCHQHISNRVRIWQHLEVHWNRTSLQHLATIPSVPLNDLYKQMITSNRPMTPFLSTDEKQEKQL